MDALIEELYKLTDRWAYKHAYHQRFKSDINKAKSEIYDKCSKELLSILKKEMYNGLEVRSDVLAADR